MLLSNCSNKKGKSRQLRQGNPAGGNLFLKYGEDRISPKTSAVQDGCVAARLYSQYSPANVNNQSQKAKTPTKTKADLLYCKTTNKEKCFRNASEMLL
jgi:hypothetical protein